MGQPAPPYCKDLFNLAIRELFYFLEMAVIEEIKSDPPTPKGSMFDINLTEKSDMLGALARIGRNAEDTAKYHYKLRDLKQRIQEASKSKSKSLDRSRSSEHSMISVISNIRSSVNAAARLSSSKK